MKKITGHRILRLTRMQFYDLSKPSQYKPRVVIGLEFLREHKASIQNFLTGFKKCKMTPWKWSRDEGQNLSLQNCPPVLQRYHQQRQQMIEDDGFSSRLFNDSDDEVPEDDEDEVLSPNHELVYSSSYDQDDSDDTETPCTSSSASHYQKSDLSETDDVI